MDSDQFVNTVAELLRNQMRMPAPPIRVGGPPPPPMPQQTGGYFPPMQQQPGYFPMQQQPMMPQYPMQQPMMPQMPMLPPAAMAGGFIMDPTAMQRFAALCNQAGWSRRLDLRTLVELGLAAYLFLTAKTERPEVTGEAQTDTANTNELIATVGEKIMKAIALGVGAPDLLRVAGLVH